MTTRQRKSQEKDAGDAKSAAASSSSSKSDVSASSPKGKKGSSTPWATIISVFVVLIGVGVTSSTQYDEIERLYDEYFGDNLSKEIRVISQEKLAQHDSAKTNKAWLAILGEVFDVSRGLTYRKGGSYDFFTGKDATAAFVTGDFSDAGLHDDVTDIPTSSLTGIQGWNDFYHKDYDFIGVLHGRYYDENGQPTAALKEYKERLVLAEGYAKEDKALRKKYPNCNQQSGSDVKSEVWCTKKAGGILRESAGVPRRFVSPGSGTARCVCVSEKIAEENKGQFELYPGCAPSSDRCELLKVAKE